MLAELFNYLRNPGSLFARELGYSKELIAIDARYKRNRKAWEPHLANSRKAMIDAVESCAIHNAVMILGGGLLFDVPIKQIQKTFKKIYIVDVVFSTRTKKYAQKNADSITLIEHDLNGLETSLAKIKKNHIPTIHASLPETKVQIDLIISANVLSQLHLAPVYYLEKSHQLDDQALFLFAQNIIKAHIDLLRLQKAQVCLLTDYFRFSYIDQKKECESALLGIELGKPDNKWRWQVAPLGELAKNESMETEVYFYKNFT